MSSPAQAAGQTPDAERRTRFGRILVATDAAAASDGAMRIGTALTGRDAAAVTVLSVVEPAPYPVPVSDLAMASSIVDDGCSEAIEARRTGIIAQCVRTSTAAPEDLLVECSVPLSAILFQATARKVELIVMGLGRHRAVDRIFGTETALHTAREAPVPTLAVPHGVTVLPRHALVGTDFSPSSLEAARVAARLVGPTGALTIVHVDPLADPMPAMLADWPSHVLDRLNDAFEHMLRALDLPATMTVHTAPLAGHADVELLKHAAQVDADVIAVGRQVRSLVERLVLGSVATKVLRAAAIPVLVVPAEH